MTESNPLDTDVRNKAQLVIVTVSSWGGEKVDKSASVATCQNQQADRKSARVVKKLVPPEALKPRGRAVTALREFVERITLPWDRGRRLLPNISYMNNLSALNKCIKEVDDRTEDFLNTFPSWQQAGQAQLGKMYDPQDYPSIHELRHKFAVSLDFEPIPRKEHFLLDLQQEVIEEISAKAELKVEEKMKEAQECAWVNLLEVTSHFAGVMADPDKRFKRSTLDKLVETLDITPQLNLSGDPMLDDVVKDIKQSIQGIDSEMLRKNSKVRTQAALETQAHAEEISNILDLVDAI